MSFKPKQPISEVRVIKWCDPRGGRSAYKHSFMSKFIKRTNIRYEYRVKPEPHYIVYTEYLGDGKSNKGIRITTEEFTECFVDVHEKRLHLADGKSIQYKEERRKK